MSDSLQDQLRALGLARKKPRTKSKHKSKGSLSLEQAYALREKEEQAAADKARRRKLAEDRKRREINQKIREIVEPNRLNSDAADLSRNFLYKGRIRKVNVSAEQLKSLNDGDLGIVYLSGGYHLLAPEHVEAVRALSEAHVPDLGSGDSSAEEEFPVPDDINW